MNVPKTAEEVRNVVDLQSLPLAYLIPAIFLAALPLPYFATSYFFLNTLIYTMLFVGLAQSWNIIGGYAGQISLGHAVMFATGAYTTAILFIYYGITPYLGLIVAGLVAAAVGLSLGALTFRLRYHYFSIATLAATLGMYVIFLGWDWIGGAVGLEYPIAQIGDSLSFMFQNRQMYFYVMWAFALGTTVLVYRLHTSKLGIYLKAIDIDQELAENAGISAFWYKMYAMGLSSFIAGIGGGLFAQYVLYVEPRILLTLLRNVEFVMMPVIGGIRTRFHWSGGSAASTESTDGLMPAHPPPVARIAPSSRLPPCRPGHRRLPLPVTRPHIRLVPASSLYVRQTPASTLPPSFGTGAARCRRPADYASAASSSSVPTSSGSSSNCSWRSSTCSR
jgi:branched-chain amino acid transport system permease protein